MTANGSLPLLMPHASADGQTEVDLKAVLYHVSIVLYTLTVVLGITGNSVVVWVAGFKLKPTVTNIWLVNLAVADLIFCLTRVVSLTKKVLYDDWPFGAFVCKFNSFFKYANMFCSVFLLAAISADRALCVWHPVFAKRRRTPRAARWVGAGVWAAALAMSAPYFAYRQVFLDKNNVSKCSLGDMDKTEGDVVRKKVLFSIRFLCGFLLPFLVILCCYVAAALGIRRTRLSGKSRPLRILASLVVAFFLCWAPYHCLLLVKMANDKDRAVKAWLSVASALAYFNSCVNPLLYFCTGLDARGGGGSRVRRTLAGAFRRALADDGDGRSTPSVDGTLEESTGSAGARTKRGAGDRVLVHLQVGGASV